MKSSTIEPQRPCHPQSLERRLCRGEASKIGEALEVSLNYLAGNSKALLEKNIVKRITDIQQLPADDKAHLFALMDAFLRDHQAKKAYAS